VGKLRLVGKMSTRRYAAMTSPCMSRDVVAILNLIWLFVYYDNLSNCRIR